MNPKLRWLASGLFVLEFFACRPRVRPQSAGPAANPGGMADSAPTVGVPAGVPPGSALAIDRQADGPKPAQTKLDDSVVATFFDDDVPKQTGGYTYVYGGKTVNRVLASGTPDNHAVFATY